MFQDGSIVFSYVARFAESGSIDTFPAAEVSFLTKDGLWSAILLLIDSGARISVLPKADASALGIVLENGLRMRASGIDGVVYGWKHDIEVKLGKAKISLPFLFLDSERSPRVLGRDGLFDKFSIVFEESKHRSGLLGAKTKESKAVSGVLDKIDGRVL